MHRIDVPSATADNKFTDGSPSGGIPATSVPAVWLNDLQENIMAVLAAAGIAGTKGDSQDLLDAINAIVNGSLAPFTPVEQGGGAGMLGNKVRIGWSLGSTLIAQVDSTTLGAFLFAAPGDVVVTASSSAPPGTLKMDGSAVSRTGYAELFAKIGTTYGAGDGSTSFNVPDARGEFIRGWDNGRGIDAGRAIGTSQADSVRSVGIFAESGNPFSAGGGAGNGYLRTGSGSAVIPAGTETRPRNIAFLFCIRY